ncbi:hypothetical protein BDA96_04G168800 [Sorghum bicolor]|uniref:Uncharacterized protein n=2 Tax=Sorghum bicolor TaxID=4558 RepID=A0A921R506_SORBI|nr:hypothetical protein SORBI_3004G157900 [Sorghum bicolor]KAG0533163.1 hypothetical protein BDA96_04G168800 [Sorghum bicolor]
MFILRLSYLSTLYAVAYRCHIPLVSIVDEFDHDGTLLHGIEIELPLLFHNDMPRRFFFWSSGQSMSAYEYEDAALQAIAFLQSLYGFTIADYNYQTMAQYHILLQQLFSLANQGAQLALFHMKLEELLHDLRHGAIFGPCTADNFC